MLTNINLLTTHRCDLHCEHCLQGFPKKQLDLPVELLDKLFTEALTFGLKKVGLTGGEPHLHPRFDEIVEKINNYGLRWGIVSHGQRIAPYLPLINRYRNQFDNIKLSIDSSDAALHDEIRGRQGVFENVTNSVKEYVANGVPVWVSSSLNQKNKGQVSSLVALAESLGAEGIVFAGTIPTSSNQHLMLSDQESLALYQEITSWQKKANLNIKTASALYTKGGVNFCPVLSLNTANFNPNGEMIFCCDVDEDGDIIGSLREQSFAQLLQQWLKVSAELQTKRVQMISEGKMIEGFDTCAFCSHFFISQ